MNPFLFQIHILQWICPNIRYNQECSCTIEPGLVLFLMALATDRKRSKKLNVIKDLSWREKHLELKCFSSPVLMETTREFQIQKWQRRKSMGLLFLALPLSLLYQPVPPPPTMEPTSVLTLLCAITHGIVLSRKKIKQVYSMQTTLWIYCIF